jgi:hypothetical protein
VVAFVANEVFTETVKTEERATGEVLTYKVGPFWDRIDSNFDF